jgi:hypothetical protein
MTAYTLFQQGAVTASSLSDFGPLSLGNQFASSLALPLAAIWFYSAPTCESLPDSISLYAVAGQALVTSQAAAWSGAPGSGWVRAAWASPPGLSAGVQYEAAVNKDAVTTAWFAETTGYWTSGPGGSGITSGPLTAPGNATAVNGQSSYGSAGSCPASNDGDGRNYWVDVEVTVAPATRSGLLLAGIT